MSHTTLCDAPNGWKQRIQELRELDKPIDGKVLLSVELALELMVYLGLDGETALAVPAILSATPMQGLSLSAQQRRAVANVRQILPYSASSAWRFDLSLYHKLPDEWRHYNFTDRVQSNDDEEDEESCDYREEWEKLLIVVARKPDGKRRHELHTELYRRCLTERLPFHERKNTFAKAGTAYSFWAELTDGEKQKLTVTFPQALIESVNKRPSPAWFNPAQERPRKPITIQLQEDLAPIADFFDAEDSAQRRASSGWKQRLESITYRPVDANGCVVANDRNVIRLNGFHHAAGMVASGKSTLAALIAGFIAKQHSNKRVTLIVGDVQTAIRLTNQLNGYFVRDIENDTPVAVPLLGRRQRSKHLRDLHESGEWREHFERNRQHWGERFLSVVCPLQGLISPDEVARKYRGLTIQAGQEPCASLTPPRQKKSQRRDENDLRTKHLCPLYSSCPVHRGVHDMPNAPIWITTPQAMIQGSLPRQAEVRPIRIGEIVYEQSDLVVVDEADAVMAVLDEAFARDEDLTNGKTDHGGGIYDRIGSQTEQFVIPQRSSMNHGQLRWSEAQRGGQNACQILLTLLNDETLPYLKRWVARDYFTPYSLFFRLARRIAGLSEHVPLDEEHAAKERFREAFAPFEQLFGRSVNDPLNPSLLRREHERRQRRSDNHPSIEPDEPAYELWQLLRDISAGGAIFGRDEALAERCEHWLITANLGLRERLAVALANWESVTESSKNSKSNKNVRRSDKPDSLSSLSHRLLFGLAAALLDRHTHIIFDEWSSRTAPEEDDIQPHRNTPPVLRDILPLPPLGRQFGTYYSPGEGSNLNRLSFLSYTNIGRWYLLHFHELFSDLQQRPGPHVLALSGTSYLPDAVRLHIGSSKSKPQGLLLPETGAKTAIAQSTFTFLPLRDDSDRPIRISGAREGADKIAALQTLTRKLAGQNGGYLRTELEALRELGRSKDSQWTDRDRLLLVVNSYDQASTVAQTLRDAWPDAGESIFHLARGETDRFDFLASGGVRYPTPKVLHRPDIESFATKTDGRILIAPMQAIGRGHNILNKNERTAAFGAIYFLIRPYPHPDDMTALARELNRRSLDWVDDDGFSAWQVASVEQRYRKLRNVASEYWEIAQRRKYWKTLRDYQDLQCQPRRDLAAYTAGLLVQSVGRLLRGGVPFHAFFVDAAFAQRAAELADDIPLSEIARRDAPSNSLLAATIVLMRDLVYEDPIARQLYEPLADALCDTRFRDGTFPYDDDWTG